MVDFKTFKKSSANLDRLAKEIDKINNPDKGYSKEDERFWTPTVDKVGNGYAVIRFLPGPAVDGDDSLPWVRVFSHGFQGATGKWYIENNLSTIEQKDPVSEFNSQLWNSSTDDEGPERKQARDQKRKLTYISNIYVEKDPANPEAEGKIFLFKYGKKIFDKISEAMYPPEIEADKAFNPYDFWTGASFNLRIRKVKGYRNYDQSNFNTQSALFDDDAKLEKTWKAEYSLIEFLDPKNFKSYDELKKKLEEVLGYEVTTGKVAKEEKPTAKAVTKPSATKAKAKESEPEGEEDSELDYFKKLAEEE